MNADSSSPWNSTTEQKKVPEGLWTKCPQCNDVLYRKELERNLSVCPKCDHHFVIGARSRIGQLLDEGTFEEWHAELKPGDPLGFNDRRPYPERILAEQKRTGLNEAAVVGQGFVRGLRTVICLTDSGFIMGSMGSVVGEKLARSIEKATELKLPVVIVSGSGGGARMHEGIFSLMQMAKVSAALARHNASGGFFLSVLTNPTMGGVAASFASLGDVILAEPKALIGFAGPKVIQQTVRVKLPEGFQTSEFLLEHGFVDRIVHRRDLRNQIALILDYVSG
jgi:acetyl-CoA carboxylase carboxyl transferase subunit beta